jgi:hypothetical protein
MNELHGIGICDTYSHLRFVVIDLLVTKDIISFSGMSFVSNGNMFLKCIDCSSRCSTTHILLVIIDISSMIMTCVFFRCFMTLLGSKRMDKYFHVGIWNVLCMLMVVGFKQSAITFVITDNSAFFPSNWKCCVMYFITKILPLLGVFVQ